LIDRCRDPRLYQEDIYYPYFAGLEREDPVNFFAESRYGPYWPVTRYKHIMAGASLPPFGGQSAEETWYALETVARAASVDG
jgi:hypothetical protein